MGSTVLVVEDERDINFIVASNLRKEGFNVVTAQSAEAGLELVHKHKPDLIVLDIMLPKMDGLELLPLLRQETSAPVLFLTAKKEELDKILGLKLGADDYITKPFSVRELIARIKAVLRRTQPTEENLNKSLRVGGLEMDFEKYEVKVGGKLLNLSPREFQILKLLGEAQGKVLSREKLSKKIWGEDQSQEIDVRTVDQHIARLRKKLLSERGRIATINSFGYRMKMDEAVHSGASRSAARSS